jgi:TatD DNase family protein
MHLRLIDSHCHLETKDFGDERDQVIERARAAGVAHFVAVGSGDSLANVENAVALAETHPDVSAAIGIHPHDVARMPDGAFAAIERLAREHPRVVAVGETGLDYHYHHSPAASQQEWFRRFIALAREAKKTLTLHIRDAHDDARRILVEERGTEVPVVVHCFTGTVADARAWLDLGAFLSFSGIVTFKSADEIRAAAALAPEGRFLVETDCPYLAPVPHRGKRNEPAFVAETVKVLAQVRGLAVEEAASQTAEAAVRAFNLPAPP